MASTHLPDEDLITVTDTLLSDSEENQQGDTVTQCDTQGDTQGYTQNDKQKDSTQGDLVHGCTEGYIKDGTQGNTHNGIKDNTQGDTCGDTLGDTKNDTQGDTQRYTQAETQSNTQAATWSNTQADTQSNTQADTQSNTQADTQSNTQADTQRNTQADTQRYTQADTQRNTQADTQRYTQADTQRYTQADTQRYTQADTQSNTQADTQRYTQADTQRYTQADTQRYTQGDTQRYTQGDTQRYTQADTQSNTQADTQSNTQAATWSNTQADTQRNTQAETQSNTQAETQSDTQAETQSNTQADTQSNTQDDTESGSDEMTFVDDHFNLHRSDTETVGHHRPKHCGNSFFYYSEESSLVSETCIQKDCQSPLKAEYSLAGSADLGASSLLCDEYDRGTEEAGVCSEQIQDHSQTSPLIESMESASENKEEGSDCAENQWPLSSDDDSNTSAKNDSITRRRSGRRLLSEDEAAAKRHSLLEAMQIDLPAKMSVVGKYSYAAVCGVNLFCLFGDTKYNKEYFDDFVKKLVEHLDLGKQVEKSIKLVVEGEGMEDCQPFVTSLQKDPLLVENSSQVVPNDLISFSLKQGCYDARIRVLIKHLCLQLRVDWEDMMDYEDLVVETLSEKEHEATEEELKEKSSKQKKRKAKRYALIGLATVGGGALLGLTGGLAAPLIAGAAAAIIGGTGAAVLTTTAAIAVIGSLFGVAGAGLGAYKMKKRVGDIEEFEFEPLSEGRSLHLAIAVTGWITEEFPDFKMPWLSLDRSSEQYALRYESKYLKQMGQAIDYLLSSVSTVAAQEALKHTVLAGLIGAIAWPATIVSIAGVLDNPWNVCAQRAVNTGRQLAEVLLSRQQGKRPVTLIGFSLGARVIFYCLQEMASRKNCEGIIEDVVMLGAPVTADPKEWQPLSRVVAGSIINGYCRTDWLLKFLYRTASVQFSIAGLQPVKWDNRRMHNMDITEAVTGHMDYLDKIDYLLDLVGVRTKATVGPGMAEDSLKQWVSAQRHRDQVKRSTTMKSKSRLYTPKLIKQGTKLQPNDGRVLLGEKPAVEEPVETEAALEAITVEVSSETPHSSNLDLDSYHGSEARTPSTEASVQSTEARAQSTEASTQSKGASAQSTKASAQSTEARAQSTEASTQSTEASAQSTEARAQSKGDSAQSTEASAQSKGTGAQSTNSNSSNSDPANDEVFTDSEDIRQVQSADGGSFTEPCSNGLCSSVTLLCRARKPSKTDDDLPPKKPQEEALRRPYSMAGIPTDPRLFNIPMPYVSERQKRHGLFFPDQKPITFLADIKGVSESDGGEADS